MRLAPLLFALVVIATAATDVALAVKSKGSAGEPSSSNAAASGTDKALGVKKPARTNLRSAVLAASFAKKMSTKISTGAAGGGADVESQPQQATKKQGAARLRAVVNKPKFKSAQVFGARARTIKQVNQLADGISALPSSTSASSQQHVEKSPPSSPSKHMQS